MKTVFVVNPKAGQGRNIDKIVERIKYTAEKIKADVDIYITKSVGDATEFVKRYCSGIGAARFIACGGDGTLNEVLNGAIDYEDAEIGALPIGTGNDFCRNFDKCVDFQNISKQIQGVCVKCDAIKYNTYLNGKKITGYCVNMFNIGFDCNVADLTDSMKKKPFISGAFAYFLSIFATLIKKKGANLKIELDGKTVHRGPLLLTSIANGSYCGGGVKSNPLASVRDGYININIVKNISRLRFIKLLPYYMKGTFLKLKNIDDIASSLKCNKVTVIPLTKKIRLCTDGEITDAGVTEFEIKPKAFNFVVPTDRIREEIFYGVTAGR